MAVGSVWYILVDLCCLALGGCSVARTTGGCLLLVAEGRGSNVDRTGREISCFLVPLLSPPISLLAGSPDEYIGTLVFWICECFGTVGFDAFGFGFVISLVGLSVLVVGF